MEVAKAVFPSMEVHPPLSLARERRRPAHPWILTLDANGVPHRWVSWQHAVFYHSKDLVAWVAGSHEFEIRGGINRVTGEQSFIRTNSIIAIKGRSHAHKLQMAVPPLNNRELFHRDRSICAYCGGDFSAQKLTRDHILPVSQGGRDLWMNVVTCCSLWPPKNLPVGCVSEFRIRSREKNPVGGTRGHHQFGLRVRGRV